MSQSWEGGGFRRLGGPETSGWTVRPWEGGVDGQDEPLLPQGEDESVFPAVLGWPCQTDRPSRVVKGTGL